MNKGDEKKKVFLEDQSSDSEEEKRDGRNLKEVQGEIRPDEGEFEDSDPDSDDQVEKRTEEIDLKI